MIQIEQWFPIHIGCSINPFHKEIEDELTQRCLELKELFKEDFEKYKKDEANSTLSSPLTSWFNFQDQKSSYDMMRDQKFDRLHNWIDNQIAEFTEKLVFRKKLNCTDGWFNFYEKYDFQDYHHHRPNALACVYFLNCKEEAGAKLLIKNTNDALTDWCNPAESSVIPLMYHNPFPGKLVIFSGYLEHAVQQHNTDDLRISLAYNYK